ncbi:MAG: hypothetical protein AAF645_21800 [Myxococcota bacterium]
MSSLVELPHSNRYGRLVELRTSPDHRDRPRVNQLLMPLIATAFCSVAAYVSLGADGWSGMTLGYGAATLVAFLWTALSAFSLWKWRGAPRGQLRLDTSRLWIPRWTRRGWATDPNGLELSELHALHTTTGLLLMPRPGSKCTRGGLIGRTDIDDDDWSFDVLAAAIEGRIEAAYIRDQVGEDRLREVAEEARRLAAPEAMGITVETDGDEVRATHAVYRTEGWAEYFETRGTIGKHRLITFDERGEALREALRNGFSTVPEHL